MEKIHAGRTDILGEEKREGGIRGKKGVGNKAVRTAKYFSLNILNGGEIPEAIPHLHLTPQ